MKKTAFCSIFSILLALNVLVFFSSVSVPVLHAQGFSFGDDDSGDDSEEGSDEDGAEGDDFSFGGDSDGDSDEGSGEDSGEDSDDGLDSDFGEEADEDSGDADEDGGFDGGSDDLGDGAEGASAEKDASTDAGAEDEDSLLSHLNQKYGKKAVSKPKKNPVQFSANGRKAGDEAELKLHGVTYRFRWCPQGKFQMGSPMNEVGRKVDEKQMEAVIPHGFWILETEVTLEMFASFVKAAKYQTDAERDGMGGYQVDLDSGQIVGPIPEANWRSVGYGQHKNFPVTNVTWYDAKKFVEWFNAELSTHEDPADSRRQVLLPTEMQWEYACRAGTEGRFCSGESLYQLAKYANLREINQNIYLMKSDQFRRNKWSLPQEGPFKYAGFVGHFEPNPWGIFDMHGNVWEWCADGYEDYEIAVHPQGEPGSLEMFVGRTGAETKNLKVMRGGGWNTSFCYARSAARGSYAPSRRFVDLGFRFIILPMEFEEEPSEEDEDEADTGSGSFFGGEDESDEKSDDSNETEEEEGMEDEDSESEDGEESEEDEDFGGDFDSEDEDSEDEEDADEEDADEEGADSEDEDSEDGGFF